MLLSAPPVSQTISQGDLSGEYQAFPDACRLHNGDIFAVFYAGYAHASVPNQDYPRGGRICHVRSSDEGLTWTAPEVLYDDEIDNRDPHISQLADGTLVCSFFSLLHGEKLGDWESRGPQHAFSYDGGFIWTKESRHLVELPGWLLSAPVRQLKDGTCIQPIYFQVEDQAWGGVIRSEDNGLTWSSPIEIGRESGIFLPAETDIIERADGSLLAILRGDAAAIRGGSDVHMHSSVSTDGGRTWSPVRDLGFLGHAPHLTRHSSGLLLLAHRGMPIPGYEGGDTSLQEFYWHDKFTALRTSDDEGETWSQAHIISTSPGAYPACVELEDGDVLIVYYEEGAASTIQTIRYSVLNAS